MPGLGSGNSLSIRSRFESWSLPACRPKRHIYRSQRSQRGKRRRPPYPLGRPRSRSIRRISVLKYSPARRKICRSWYLLVCFLNPGSLFIFLFFIVFLIKPEVFPKLFVLALPLLLLPAAGAIFSVGDRRISRAMGTCWPSAPIELAAAMLAILFPSDSSLHGPQRDRHGLLSPGLTVIGLKERTQLGCSIGFSRARVSVHSAPSA